MSAILPGHGRLCFPREITFLLPSQLQRRSTVLRNVLGGAERISLSPKFAGFTAADPPFYGYQTFTNILRGECSPSRSLRVRHV